MAGAAHDIRVKWHHSLVVRSMGCIALLLAIIAELSVYVSQTEIQEKALSELQENSARVLQGYAQDIAPALSRGDKVELNKKLSRYTGTRETSFCGAQVLDTAGEIVAKAGFPLKQAIDEFTLTQPVIHPDKRGPKKGKEIGTFQLCARQAVVEAKINETIIRELVRFGILMIFVLGAVYWALQILIRPLMGVVSAMGNVARTMQPITDPALLRDNEVGLLARGFNDMVSDLAETYSALDAARQRAIKSEGDKTDFLANMSHELRSPLNNIIGSVQLLHDRPMAESDHEMFEIIEKSSNFLLGIVNDILDLSKIEAGQVRLERIPFDVFEKVRDVSQAFAPQASKKGLVMSCQTDNGKLRVVGDPMRFERILTNITGNALRYTDKGSIRLVAHASDAGNGLVRVRCEVIDTGIGIPKERQDKIFNRYAQAEDSTARRFGGTGLGLTITRELIHLMGGTLGLDSEVGKGTNFWFEAPFALAEAEGVAAPVLKAAGPRTGIPAAKARVLVAEDHELNRSFIRRLFDNIGIRNYSFAQSGREAVEEVLKGNFTVVLMDCHMPEMDGYIATASIRNLPDAFQRKVPIVAMTANAMEGERERCLAAGMDDYVSKPFEIEKFKKVLSPWIDFEDAEPLSAPEKKAASDAPADLNILHTCSKGDEKFIHEMVDLFITTAAQCIRELKDLSNAGGAASHTAWSRAAHGLKGVAGIVGATHFQQLAQQAEKMEEGKTKKKALVKELEAEYAKLVKFFQDTVLKKANI